MFNREELEGWLLEISGFVKTKSEIFLIGGCALSFRNIKNITKDIDIITTNKNDFRLVNDAILKAGYKLETDLDNEFYLTALAVYKKGDSRIDMFLQKVGQMLTFTPSMQKRVEFYKSFNLLNVYLASKEDIFLFKAMTPREADILDCDKLMAFPLNYDIIFDEIKQQSITGNKWFFWVFEKICAIENYTDKRIPIKSKIYALVKEHWSYKPDDFMQDIGNKEQHIADKKLLKEL